MSAQEIAATESKLKLAQEMIDSKEEAHCWNSHSNAKKKFLDGHYDKFGLDGIPSLVYPFCLYTKELGNKLGNYFTEIGCAEQAGLNFLAVHKRHDISASSYTNVTTKSGAVASDSAAITLKEQQKHAFLDALPTSIAHSNPSSREVARSKVNKKCTCTRYCWSDANAPWVNSTENIGKYVLNAVKVYLEKVDTSKGTTISADTDITNAKEGQFLPTIPDVAIQYRCGDNIGFNYMYGLLPFWAFTSRIPKDTKTIYVLADHPTRNLQATYAGRCQNILEALFHYLEERFPDATIVVKRGGDIFLDVARFALAKVLICSASTFCVWPALANENVAHFPLTSLIAGADNMQLAPDFGPRFQWIQKPLLISDLRRFRPWDAVIDFLKTEGATGD